MNILFYVSKELDNLKWIEDQISVFLYEFEESIGAFSGEDNYIIECEDGVLKLLVEGIVENLRRHNKIIEDSMTKAKTYDCALMLMNKKSYTENDGEIVDIMLVNVIPFNIRYYTEEDNAQYHNFK